MIIANVGGADGKTHQSGNVYDVDDTAPSIMAGTHGYGFGYILEVKNADNGASD